jgi:hypothetical protein
VNDIASNKQILASKDKGQQAMAKTRELTGEETVQPRNIQRADIAPSSGFALVVDGRIKTEYDNQGAANKAAEELLSRFPKLQVQIYDAETKTRTSFMLASDGS